MKNYRVILIDPARCSITEMKSDASLDSIYKLVGTDKLDHFKVASFDPDGATGFDFGWVDDFGLKSGVVDAFKLAIRRDPIAGKCLIVGSDEKGKTVSCRIPIEVLREGVVWLGRILPEVTWVTEDTGPRAVVTYARAK